MRHSQQSVAITDRSSVGEARRAAIKVAQLIGFDVQRRSDIGIVTTELANNVLLHGLSGELLICPIEAGSEWLDIMALDKGPGIRDVNRAFEDGVSTIGTAGHGLGAAKRLSDEISLYSNPGAGTVAFCRFKLSQASKNIPLGVVSIPVSGEVMCGDSYLVLPGAKRSLFMVVDGLGHGVIAADAANEALKAVKTASQESLSDILTTAHNALKATRGAAMSIAIVDHERLVVTYAGVGNVSAAIASSTSSQGMASRNGTLGAVFPKVQEYTYPFQAGAMLLMFSDGLSSRCGLNDYHGGILKRPPGLIAALLYRDFSRGRDDATVLVASLEGDHAW